MADNVTANAGAGGAVFATDDIASVHYPRSKQTWGPDGTANDVDVATGKPLPVQLRTSTGVEPVLIDGAAFTPATSPVLMVGAEFDDVAPGVVIEGRAGGLRMAANRCLYVNLRDNAGNERGLNVDASGNVTVNVTGSLPAGTAAIGKLAANTGVDIGDVDVTSVPADPFGLNADVASATGSISAKLRFIAGTGIPVTGTVTVGSHAVTNAGTFAVQVDGAALTALQLIDDAVFTDGAVFTPAVSKVLGIGMQADETAPASVDEGDIGCPRMTLDRKQIATLYAHTAGGCLTNSQLSTAAVISTAVKASPGQVYGIHCFNNGANEVFLRLYNQTTAPAGTDNANIVYRAMIPGNAAGAGFVVNLPQGIEHATGIGLRVTGAVGDTDTTVLAANEVMVTVLYK